MANIAMLREVLDYIKAHPEEHNQDSFICDTTACFAGHTALMDGWLPEAEYYKDGKIGWSIIWYKGDERRYVDDIARGLLDLSSDQSHRLFFIASNVHQVERVVNNIIVSAEENEGLRQ